MTRKRGITVAAAIVAMAVAGVGLSWNLHSTEGPMIITAQFEDTVGLYAGNAVAVLGMPVGKVTSITPKDSYVEVKLAVDKGIDIPADVQAVTLSTSVLTSRQVELTPPYRGGPKLRNGDILNLSRTRTPVEFDRTLAVTDKLAVAMSGDGHGHGPLADLISLGAQISTHSGPDIKATLEELRKALRLGADHGAATKEAIQAIVTNVAELTQAAADNDTAIREFGSDIRQLSDIIAAEDLGSGSTGAKINKILEQAARLLAENQEGLKSTVADGRALTSAVVDNRRELAEFFDVAPLLADNIYNALDTKFGLFRGHLLMDKAVLDSQFSKELCNMIGLKQLGCATGTLSDYGPDFGLTGMLDLMAGIKP